MDEMSFVCNIRDRLLKGDLSCITSESIKDINDISMRFLNGEDNLAEVAREIILISNILYNNTDKSRLPLDDGVYDILLEKTKKFCEVQVGAPNVYFKPTEQERFNLKKIWVQKEPINTEGMMFYEELSQAPKPNMLKKIWNKYHEIPVRRVGDAVHPYPELAGTLDKCKFVLNKDAVEKGVFEDSNVKVLERDFFGANIMNGVLDPNRVYNMDLELKYDGVSVEADVSNRIISARSRGDANKGIATDLTPLLEGYRFRNAEGKVDDNDVFGMQFEAVMSYFNLQVFNEMKGIQYKNCRTAISALFSSTDALKYRDLITLVPIRTSLGIGRQEEVEFINKYYNNGEYLRHVFIKGTLSQLLYSIYIFSKDAEYLRPYMPFMYDGIVVSFMDEDVIERLGRVSNVNQYQMAVKFNPLKRFTIFRGYDYTIGQNGKVTPMIHYDPVEFYGTIHDKSTGHSYKRFKELDLRYGDIIEVEYVNDVMPYVSKPMNSENQQNAVNPPISFIDTCPSCGSKLVISDSGKEVLCINKECPARNIKRIASLMAKLNLKDFSEAQIAKIGKYSLSEMLSCTKEDVEFLGDITSDKFIERMNYIKTAPIYDYNLIGALGFEDIAVEKWKLILHQYSLLDLYNMYLSNPEQLKLDLTKIKGIGPKISETIVSEMEFFMKDIQYILQMNNIIISKGMKLGKKIRFTGVRDSELVKVLLDRGHSAGEGAITKDTDILIVPDVNHISSKTKKAVQYGIQIVPLQEFIENMDSYLK